MVRQPAHRLIFRRDRDASNGQSPIHLQQHRRLAESFARLHWFTNVFQQGETPLNRRRHAIRLQSADIVSLLLSVRWTPTVDACLWLYSEWYPWLVNYDAI